MKTIQAKVSPKILQKAHLLFNQSHEGLLHEILQNCRRARATNVEITVLPSGEGSKITILDNGIGIGDPQNLLHLGNSGWEEDIQGMESPAGMGFFSLCHLPEGVSVASNDWETHIDAAGFRGSTTCELHPRPHLTGTKLTFFLPIHQSHTIETFEKALRFYPIQATLNKKPATQMGFLSKVNWTTKIDGGTIGISPTHQSDYEPRINFYGITIQTKINSQTNLVPELWPVDVLVDLTDNSTLDLVLPARQTIVQNRKLENLRTACRRATYQFLLETKTAHNLPHSYYKEAHSMGIPIQEAKPELMLEMPTNIHEGFSYWSGETAPNYPGDIQKETPHAGSILSKLADSEVAALHISGQPIPLLFREKPGMEGYSWYPKNKATKLVQVLTFPDGKTIRESTEEAPEIQKRDNTKKSDHPKTITLELTLDINRVEEIKTFPTFIAFDASDWGEEAVASNWLPKKGNAEKVDTDILKALFFSPSSEPESDSYETQEEYFNNLAQFRLNEVTRNSRQARLQRAHDALNEWDPRIALEALNAKTLILHVHPKNGITIEIPKTKKTKKA